MGPAPQKQRSRRARRLRGRMTMAVGGGVVALALVAAGCSSSSSSTGNNTAGGSNQLHSGVQALNPGTGSPKTGGTLRMLGAGDVDYMDYNASYYTIGYLAQRMWQRALYAYPATPGHVTTPVPDLATAMPVVSNGGKM